MRDLLKGRTGLFVAFVLGATIAAAGTATGAALVTGRQIKDGTITMRDLSKSVRAKLATAGATGPAGAKGDAGVKGDPGPTLVRHTQNAESGFAISSSPTTVAVIGETSEATYSGSYSGALVHPAGLTYYLVVNVQAHVLSVTGTGVSCELQDRLGAGSWNAIAKVDVPSSGTREAYMNASFPSFAEGSSWSFRIRCNTSSGSGTARGEIGVIAGGP